MEWRDSGMYPVYYDRIINKRESGRAKLGQNVLLKQNFTVFQPIAYMVD